MPAFFDTMNNNAAIKSGVVGIVLAIVVISLDGDCLNFGFVNWDDDLYLVSNPHVLTPSKVEGIDHILTRYLGYPIPITIGSYLVEYNLWGLNPMGYHATNLIIHMITTWLVFSIGRVLGISILAAGLSALLFVVHPITVEPVAWVTGRKDLLAACFCLLSLRLYLGDWPSTKSRRLWLSGFLFLLSLLSKPAALGFPFLILAVDHWITKTNSRENKIFFWSISVIVVIIAVLSTFFESEVGAFTRPNPIEQISQIGIIAYSQMQHLLLPLDLLPKYLYVNRSYWLETISVLIVFLLIAYAIWKPPKASRVLSFALLWIVLAYLPVSGIAPLTRQIADSYLYFPMVAVAWSMGWLLDHFLRGGRPYRVWVILGITLVLISALVPLRKRTISLWRDSVSLWAAVYEVYPDSPQVCRNFGNAFLLDPHTEPFQPRPHMAIKVYERCMKTMASRRDYFVKNLAIAYFMIGQWDKSEKLFRQRLKSHPQDEVATEYLGRIRRD